MDSAVRLVSRLLFLRSRGDLSFEIQHETEAVKALKEKQILRSTVL